MYKKHQFFEALTWDYILKIFFHKIRKKFNILNFFPTASCINSKIWRIFKHRNNFLIDKNQDWTNENFFFNYYNKLNSIQTDAGIAKYYFPPLNLERIKFIIHRTDKNILPYFFFYILSRDRNPWGNNKNDKRNNNRQAEAESEMFICHCARKEQSKSIVQMNRDAVFLYLSLQ